MPSYTYNRSITIDHTKLGSTSLTNFPVLVHGNNATFKTVGNGGHVQNASGFDIGFFSDATATTAYKWEMLAYDGSTGEFWAFVKVPSVSHSVDTVFSVCYGDGSISTFQSVVSDVWTGYYRVMHLNESAHPYADVTSRADNSTSTNDPTQVAGKFNKAQSFVGASTQSITVSQTGTGFSSTVSGWFKSSTTSGVSVVILDDRGNVSLNGQVLYVNANVPSYYRNNVGPIVGSSGVCDGNWHYLVGVSNSTTPIIRIYIDGAAGGTFGGTGNPEAIGAAYIGRSADASPAWATAVQQEIRQSNSELSADWILTDYNNQNDPDTFLAFGSENVVGGSSIPVFMNTYRQQRSS